MTTKRIKLDYGTDFEEVEEEDLTSVQALKLWTTYTNRYVLRTLTHLWQGKNHMCIKISRKQARELLTTESPTKYKNCETSSRWRIRITRSYISISASEFQDFSKTSENNWGSLE